MATDDFEEIPQPLGLFAAELFIRATEFLSASKLMLDQKPELRFPGSYLLAHSIELFLKSYFASCGVSKHVIRKLGHDIIAILSKFAALDLPQIKKLPELVAHIDIMNVITQACDGGV